MPAKNTLIVEHIPNNSTYEIINVKGAVVASGELTLFSDKIDISSINTGTYYITFRNEIHEISRKIIVLK